MNTLSIILKVLFFPIWILWVIAKHFSRKNKQQNISDDPFLQDEESILWYEKQNDVVYQNMLNKHFQLTDEINTLASVLHNLKITKGPRMDILIDKCQESIAMADTLNAYWEKYSDAPYRYEAFRRLAIIYENQERYEEGMQVCAKAIKLGFVEDGTDGKMYGRLSRLIRKSGIELTDEYTNLLEQ